MYKESLEKAREIISQVLCTEKDINLVDKVELMMNIDYFLENYDEMIKVKVKKK